jgi:CcmD family protein
MIEFLAAYPTYVVLTTALIIWAGIAWYIVRIDRRLAEIERRQVPS